MRKKHTYDIIIPICKPGKSFTRTLEMLKKQVPAPEKIILLETLADGETFVPYRGCEVVVIPGHEFDHASTRRLGVSYSTAEVFIMMTQDAVPVDTRLCARLLEGLYAGEEDGTALKNKKANELSKIISAYHRSSVYDSFGAENYQDYEEDRRRLADSVSLRRKRKKMKSRPPIDSTVDMEPDTSSWDNVPCEQYVNLIRKHERETEDFPALPEGRIAMCYARQVARKSDPEIEKFIRNFNYPDKSVIKSAADIKTMGIKAFFASNVCCAYNRDLYESIMGFETRAVFNEDMLYAAKALKHGYRIAYAADARVIHSHNYSAFQQFRRNFDNGMSQAMHPEIFDKINIEGEGKKLVKKAAIHLIKSGKAFHIVKLVWQSAFKYMGFRLGRKYRKLSYARIHRYTMNKTFVEKNLRSHRPKK